MKSVRQIPLLATTAAMILLAFSTNTDWMRIAASAVGTGTLFLFVRANRQGK